MYLEDIRLINFRNYKDIKMSFNDQINCLVGDNGVGKTNVLEGIYYLALTKSFQGTTDLQAIRHETDFFSIMGKFNKDGKQKEVKCQMKRGEKKTVSLNELSYEKISNHIGIYPVVLITPNDTDIIRGGGENRRRFVDSVISQLNRIYLDNLLNYNHALRQRNSILKNTQHQDHLDIDLIEPYDQLIMQLGYQIYQARREFVETLSHLLKDFYSDISDHKEKVNIRYKSDLESENFNVLFKGSLSRDIALRRTSLGIHRDDYIFEIDGYPMKKYASQGQQKSMIVSLKIAQFEIIRTEKGFKPIILMDDIFDKLDDARIEKILNMVAGHTFGQIFVTDARPERTLSIFDRIETKKSIYQIVDGKADLL